jgi:hypothetical protein
MTNRHARALTWALWLASASGCSIDIEHDDGERAPLASHEGPPPLAAGSLRVTRTTPQCASGPWTVTRADETGVRVYTVSTPNTYTELRSANQQQALVDCALEGELRVPDGASYALAAIDAQSTVRLEDMAEVRFSLSHVVRYHPRLEERTTTVTRIGPYAGTLALRQAVPPTDQTWSACGEAHPVKFRTMAELKNHYPWSAATFAAEHPEGTTRFSRSRDQGRSVDQGGAWHGDRQVVDRSGGARQSAAGSLPGATACAAGSGALAW